MNRSSVLSCVTVFAIATTAQAQVPTEKGHSAGKDRISITISTKENSFKLGTSIPVGIVVKNVSDGEYCESHILEMNHAERNGYHLEVKDGSGKAYVRIPLRLPRGMLSTMKLCLAPGAIRKESLLVDQVVNVTDPGTYVIRVEHPDRETNTNVWSNSITITITP